jgi:tRNA U55 pseudouridine synthase TruB
MPERKEIAQFPPERSALFTRREYRDALERLSVLAQRELRIFDADVSDLELNSPRKYELLRAFLVRGRNNRLYIAVHDADYIRNYCPRLLALLRQFSDCMFIHQTQGEAARAQDSFVLADQLHFVRRPVRAQPRATLALNDDKESEGMLLRFSEIWDSSVPAASATTSGL